VVWLAPKEVDPGAFGNETWVYAAIAGQAASADLISSRD
jgi:hypothetical protein